VYHPISPHAHCISSSSPLLLLKLSLPLLSVPPLMLTAAGPSSSKMLVPVYQTTEYHIPLHCYCCENLKFQKFVAQDTIWRPVFTSISNMLLFSTYVQICKHKKTIPTVTKFPLETSLKGAQTTHDTSDQPLGNMMWTLRGTTQTLHGTMQILCPSKTVGTIDITRWHSKASNVTVQISYATENGTM
jgi:hypothetical protein